jgi:hypothetical protein
MTEERARYWTHPALPAVDLLEWCSPCAGPGPGRRTVDDRLDRGAGHRRRLLPVQLLGLSVPAGLTLDARAVGLAVAGIALRRRAPFLVVVVLAVVVTALVRLL